MDHDNFEMDYSGVQPKQSNGPQAPREYDDQSPYRAVLPKRQWVIPSILKTFLTFLIAAALFFGSEIVLPDNFKPSTLVGTYDARLSAAVKAAELQQQVKYDGWAISYKTTYDQNLEQYKAATQGILRNYDASYQLNNTVMTGYIQLHQQYKGVLYSYTQQTQSADMSLSNMSTGWGRILNLLQPGAGDSALEYADTLKSGMKSELRDAAADDFPLELKDWQSKLASPEEVRAQIESVKLLPPPPMPQIGEDAPRQDFSKPEEN